MTMINLKEFYYWYEHDEFVEVSDEVAAELLAGRRLEKNCQRKMYRYNANYSLDADNGIEASVMSDQDDSPERIMEMKDRYCDLCRALNSLPEIQGRRIEARYMLGKSQTEIAKSEGVCMNSVNGSIVRGLRAMKKYLGNAGAAH